SVASYRLTVTTSGSGTVTSTPAGINCGSTCSANYTGGTQVTLTATPASGAVFAGWGGACSGTAGCSVTMNAAATVTATFGAPRAGRCPPPAGEVGVAYSATCSASGGTAPYSCSLGSGTVPAGLTLASSCSITGTPTSAGTGTFTVRVTDAVNNALN